MMKININELKDSNDFLNTLLDNIDTAVFIADENMQIQQFNNSFLSLFSGTFRKQAEKGQNPFSGLTFGNAAGCINAIRENKTCGDTSSCQNCKLKNALVSTLKEQTSHNKKSLEREFYINGKPTKKYLEFSSRAIVFQDQKMILFFVYDVTKIELSKLELKKKQEQIDIDLEKAGEIQKSLLPRDLPDISSIRADWFFEPSSAIGGDIFHIRQEKTTHISAYMLDVCGHGVSAALIAVTVKQFLDQLHAQGLSRNRFLSPEQILNALEKEFPFERFDCFFTIAYIRLNLETGKLVYGCAGHVPPVVVGHNNRFTMLDRHGIIIGLSQDIPFYEYETQLELGDKIILYTDGLIDYFGEKGAAPNKDCFYEALKDSADLPCEQMVKKVMEKQQKLCGSAVADDDISLLVIEYNEFKPVIL